MIPCLKDRLIKAILESKSINKEFAQDIYRDLEGYENLSISDRYLFIRKYNIKYQIL